MLRRLAFSFMLAATFVGVADAQSSSESVDRLAWLSGCWAQTRPDGLTEEHWMKPSGGTMLGMSRTVRGGRTTEFEFLQIKEVDGKLAYVARPSGQAEATFPLKSMTDVETVFENPTHDFPQRIIYRKSAHGSVTARIEGTINGKARGIDFPFKRCA
jgi:Domain of unknown function (DUF6265)